MMRRRLAACLFVCCLVALAPAGAALPAEEPSPQELWKLYPLDPTGRGKAKRPATPTEPDGPPSPRSGVAGLNTTRSRGGAVVTKEDSEDGGTPLWLGLVLGGLVAALLMLAFAALPARAVPRRGAILADRRLDMTLAGVLALLVVTIVYLAIEA